MNDEAFEGYSAPCDDQGRLSIKYLPRVRPPISTISIEEQFRYHPPDEERKVKHEKVNRAALDLALALKEANSQLEAFVNAMDETLDHDTYTCRVYEILSPLLDILRHEAYIFIIQQARMFANQGITMDDLLNKRAQEVQ